LLVCYYDAGSSRNDFALAPVYFIEIEWITAASSSTQLGPENLALQSGSVHCPLGNGRNICIGGQRAKNEANNETPSLPSARTLEIFDSSLEVVSTRF
jgi:hypothetical protein